MLISSYWMQEFRFISAEEIMPKFFLLLTCLLFLARLAPAQDDEIVANLAGGRVIVQVAQDGILFAAIDHPLESKSVPPRVAPIGSGHIAIFLGASEWQAPAEPKPIRLDRDIQAVVPPGKRYQQPEGAGENDLEQIGVIFLEKLRPLVTQLHHKIDLKPDEPLFEIVLIGYAPQDYGPEVWVLEYFVEQEEGGRKGDYWKTHIQRPRFTQLYPPEKHQPRVPVEARFPTSLPGVPLLGLLQQNDPSILQLKNSDVRFAKVIQQLQRGESQKANTADAEDFLRAALPIIAGNSKFIQGTLSETRGFSWIVPPDEPIDKEQKAQEKNRQPEAPTLRRKSNTN
jgi:hypothetical protein